LGARDEDDRRLLEPGMLVNQARRLEPIHVRHIHVQQDDGEVLVHEPLQGLAARPGRDQPLPQLAQDGLVAEQLARLVVDHKDPDLVAVIHAACHR